LREVFDIAIHPHNIVPEQPRVNKWPDSKKFPFFQSTCEEYLRHVKALSERLFSLFCLSLGSEPNSIDEIFSQQAGNLRLCYYPKQSPSSNLQGCGAHRDQGFMAIIWQNAPGLEVYHGGQWCSVPVVPGTLIVNVGDLACVLSNERYKSPLHRVVGSMQHERFSVPFFVTPSFDAPVTPLESTGKAKYRPTTWREYFSESFLGGEGTGYTGKKDRKGIEAYRI